VIDLDPTHQVLRATFRNVLTDQLLIEAYHSVARLASQGGPYAAMVDGSGVTKVEVSSDTIRSLAQTAPAVPGGRPRVVVANKQAVFYDLARMFELMRGCNGRTISSCPVGG